MEDKNDLEKFREQWKKELSHPTEREKSSVGHVPVAVPLPDSFPRAKSPVAVPVAGPGIVLHSSKPTSSPPNPPLHRQDDDGETSTEQTYYPFRILGQLLKEGSTNKSDLYNKDYNDQKLSDNKRKYFENEKSYENIQLKKRHCDPTNTKGQYGPLIHESKHRHNKVLLKKEDRYLDLFIADLDEINEIPFFDVTLPKEVAVNIFKHLSIEDLCHCAQVSKSWKSLADDELLWCKICHRLGYEEGLCTLEMSNWKEIVRQHITQQKTLISNWKGRVGKLSQLQHVQGGVVCAVTSHLGLVVAGYNNGDVKMWDLSKGDNCVFQPSSTALQIDERREEGTVSNYVLHVDTSPQITVASYTHRHIDVWLNEQGLAPVNTFRCEGGWDISALKVAKLSPLIALSQGYYVQVYRADPEMNFSIVDKLDISKMVSQLKWIEPSTHQFNSRPLLAIATPNIIRMYDPGKGAEHLQEIHNIIDSPVTCFDQSHDPYQMGVACGMFGGPTEAFKVHLYDMASGRLTSSLLGHTWMVTCLNMADSPEHTLVTGCGDRKVRVYDPRQSVWPCMTLVGHSGKITTIQMDDWKVVSGDEGGFVRVWDRRMTRAKLWEWHNRHPVHHCSFREELLVVGNVPIDKFPVLEDQFDRMLNTRYRGTIQVYDFSTDQTTQGVPEICHSSYDQPDTYNYNIRLAVPYDNL